MLAHFDNIVWHDLTGAHAHFAVAHQAVALEGEEVGLSPWRVVEVDVVRKRIALTMKLGEAPARKDLPRDNRFEGAGRHQRSREGLSGGYTGGQSSGYTAAPAAGSAMASAFAKLQNLKK